MMDRIPRSIHSVLHQVEAMLVRVPLVYKITSWYSIFLLVMVGLLATFVMQFTSAWDEHEIRSELHQNVIEAATNPKKFKPYDNGIFLVVYSHDGVILRGSVPERFSQDNPPSFNTTCPFKSLMVHEVTSAALPLLP